MTDTPKLETISVPDGEGGFKDIQAERLDGKSADRAKQEATIQKESEEAHESRVGAAAEAFNKMHKAYATDFNLTEEEVVKSMYLELLNWKEFYPKELGGTLRFDELCKEAWTWFESIK